MSCLTSWGGCGHVWARRSNSCLCLCTPLCNDMGLLSVEHAYRSLHGSCNNVRGREAQQWQEW